MSVAVAAADTAGPPAADDRPLLFLHIPKTAGTSLLTTLGNLFGDNRLLRVDVAGAGCRLREVLAEIVATRLDGLSCLAGHLPMYAMAPYLPRFRPFTLLREPVARVFSLYRFLRRAPAADLADMGLHPGFSFDEFIASRHHGVFEQMNNGMCRMLTDDIRLCDPNSSLFWRIDPEPEHAERALAMLERLDVGLVEDMARTRQLLQARWNLPYALDEYVENTTARDEPEPDLAQLQLVIRRNILDMALYQRAAATFRARVADLRGSGLAATRAAFHPVLNETAAVADIAGRQGFHVAEQGDFAWLRADGPARIHFHAPGRVARIRLQLYCITGDYPIDGIMLRLNGARVPQQAKWLSGARWCELEISPPSLRPGLNELAIDPPTYLSVRQFDSASPDFRYLSVALATLTLVG